jgi:proton glutamate symport protein
MEKKKFKLSMTNQIILATIGGILFGALVGPLAGNLKFIGDIFIRLIQMSVVVLVMSSVISAVGEMKGKVGGKIGFNTFKWIMTFTLLSTLMGLFLSNLIQPGIGMKTTTPFEVTSQEPLGWQETLVNFVSTNVIGAMANGEMIPCIVFALLFGLGINKYVKTTGNTIILDWVKGLNAIVLNVIQMVMKLAPLGIFSLLANVAGVIGFSVIVPMLKYLFVLALGVGIMMIVFALFTAIRCGINPLLMPKKFMKISMIALTTTSSAITFPSVLEDSVTKFGVNKRISDFTLPIGMSMGSCGAALCNVTVIMFLSQSAGIQLSLSEIALGIGLSIMLCMGTITVPGGFAVTATFLATSLGLPPEAVALMLGVDWFAGMFRTFLNVNGDVLVTLLVANAEGEIDKDVYNEKKQAQLVAVGHGGQFTVPEKERTVSSLT